MRDVVWLRNRSRCSCGRPRSRHRGPAPFSDELVGAGWQPAATGAALGATFIGRSSARGSEWDTRGFVDACDEPHVFGWRATRAIQRRPADEAQIIERRLAPIHFNLTNVVEGIKRAAEAADRSV
jgi:hypothetical protein